MASSLENSSEMPVFPVILCLVLSKLTNQKHSHEIMKFVITIESYGVIVFNFL